MERKLSRRQFELAAMAALGTAVRAAAQTTSRVKHVPWLDAIQRPPDRLPADAPQLPSLLVDARGDRITTFVGWQRRREEIRTGWQQFLGEWEYPRRPPEYEIISTDRTPTVTRRLIRYEVERNVPVEAYLLLPHKIAERAPGVVVFHSTVDYTIRQGAGLEGDPRAAWGLRLAERGFVALCPRCFLWDGTVPVNYQIQVARHQERHPATLGMAKMLYDGRRALDVLAAMDQVDPARLGAAGHSLGAKEALYLAAFDERVKAAVFSEGGIGVGFSNWDAPWYLGSRPQGHDHHELLALIAPRPFLIIGGDSADGARSWPFVARALEVYQMHGLPCRIGLYNHRQGHSIPTAAEGRTYDWLQTYV
jgi:hypothetical protein